MNVRSEIFRGREKSLIFIASQCINFPQGFLPPYQMIQALLWMVLCVAFFGEAANVSSNLSDQPSNCSDPRIIAHFFQYSEEHSAWRFTENNECGFEWFSASNALNEFRGKSLLFVGDSTVRNAALTLLATLCNPVHYADCAQLLLWPFATADSVVDAFRCHNLSSTNRCSEMEVVVSVLPGLTGDRHYRNKAERKRYWQLGIVPPLVTARFEGLTVNVLEAGCARHSDGLWKILDYLQHNATNSMISYDAMLVSGGMHCSYQQYRAAKWYLSLSQRWPYFVARVPVVWIEISNCTKTNAGHFWWYGRQQRLNYRKLVSCDYAAKHIKAIESIFTREGVLISPTRFISRNITKANASGLTLLNWREPCPFVDDLHPSLPCYGAMLQVHLNALHVAFAQRRSRATNDASGSVRTGIVVQDHVQDEEWFEVQLLVSALVVGLVIVLASARIGRSGFWLRLCRGIC